MMQRNINYNNFYNNPGYNDNPNSAYYGPQVAYQPAPMYMAEPVVKQPAMNMVQAFKSFWKNYANFHGTAPRSEYWWNKLIYILILVAALLLMLMSISLTDSPAAIIFWAIIFGIYFLAAFIPAISLNARRLHDIGLSGWWQLLLCQFTMGVIIVGCIPTKPYSKYRIPSYALNSHFNAMPQPNVPYSMNINPNAYYASHPNVINPNYNNVNKF